MENMEPPPPLPPPQQFLSTPLMISMVGIMSTAIAIVVYHYILMKYCVRRQNLISQPIQRSERAAGVDENVLECIPIITYSSKQEGLFRMDQIECAVCLGELEEEEIVRLLPNCRHVFHVQCIDEWFFSHSNCPICRSPISPILTPMPPMPLVVEGDDETQLLPRHGDHSDSGGNDASASITRVKSIGLLRHCASLVAPTEKKTPQLPVSLKRSLSMDYSYVNLKMQVGHEREPSSSSPSSSSSFSRGSLLRSSSHRVGSSRHLDRASSMLIKSFSRLRSGHSGPTNGILPR